jgi:2-polyprenyl-3-methyl-5-hydroxy-6-metoxy-1,4-benzoquinol methylase
MSLGTRIRRAFGPYEHHVADAYRRVFVDLGAFVRQMQRWTSATNILEIGCGEGAVTERLVRAFPDAQITAIDITPSVGRLFRGDASRVNFRQAPVEEIAATAPGAFDVVVLADVIHHVPTAARGAILASARAALAPRGRFVFKDWARRNTPIHLACLLSDRYLTGDDVHYLTAANLRELAIETFGPGSIAAEAFIPPWKSNFAMLIAAR